MAEVIGQGFNLIMQLRDPSQLPALSRLLVGRKPTINAALMSLDYVHSARFLPIFQQGLLLIVTEFDGDMKDYVMDFAAALDEEFSLILSFMKDAPPLPVSRYPSEFWAYVERNTKPPEGKYPDVFMPYQKTVLEIVGADRAKELPAQKAFPGPRKFQLEDLQANIVQGYGGDVAMHFGVRFSSASSGRAFIAALLAPDGAVRVTPAAPWPKDKPPYCLNIGFTHAGLQALEVAYDTLRRFPRAFAEGPLARASAVGDDGNNAPSNWQTGEVGKDGKPVAVHALLSLYEREKGSAPVGALRDLMAEHRVVQAYDEPIRAAVLKERDTVHFGYRDGLSLPKADPIGDFILGADHVNARGGFYIGSLPEGLAGNATYGALRVIEQHPKAFDDFLDDAEKAHGVSREWIAAKLMGRWRDGSPLTLRPEESAPAITKDLDDFDYVADSAKRFENDYEGLHCPMGAHIRRFNPRGGVVLGVPRGRRVLRRGMPYGPQADKGVDDGKPRGLVGLFYCGDLETQYEFLLKVWANQDVSASGLRGTIEPFVGSRKGKTPFRITRPDGKELTLGVPVLSTCRGSLYVFVPGISGLHWLADGAKASRVGNRTTAPAVDVTWFDPADPAFRADPYPFYAAFRTLEKRGGLQKVGGGHDSYWVFSRSLVEEICTNDAVFQKPGKRRNEDKSAFGVAAELGDGLFFMDSPRHDHVRHIMETAFDPAHRAAKMRPRIRQLADDLLGKMAGRSTCELVGEYAAQLPMQVFMAAMGIPDQHVRLVDSWVRTALRGHDRTAPLTEQAAGGTASMALRTYFLGLLRQRPHRDESEAPALIDAMKQCTAHEPSDDRMSPFEAMNTALQFALGGYLSTQFLIASGAYALLQHPEQWNLLCAKRDLMERAVDEMVRYEAPFQIADRWVAEDHVLGNGFKVEKHARLAVIYGSANRDAPSGEKPDEFLITREPGGYAFGFGHGRHKCIGLPLARVVAQEAIDALLDHYPFARLGPVGPWSTDPYFRSLSQLTLLLR